MRSKATSWLLAALFGIALACGIAFDPNDEIATYPASFEHIIADPGGQNGGGGGPT